MYQPPPEISHRATRRQTDRAVFHLARKAAQLHDAGAPVVIDRDHPPSDLRLITRRAVTDFGDRRDEVYTANITLMGGAPGQEQVLLQCFAPLTHNAFLAMRTAADLGSRLLTKMMLEAHCHSEKLTARKRTSAAHATAPTAAACTTASPACKRTSAAMDPLLTEARRIQMLHRLHLGVVIGGLRLSRP